jgi:hypothetical protein
MVRVNRKAALLALADAGAGDVAEGSTAFAFASRACYPNVYGSVLGVRAGAAASPRSRGVIKVT